MARVGTHVRLSRSPEPVAPTTKIIARPFRPQSSVVGDFVSILGLTPLDLNMDPNFRANAQEPISLAVAGFYRSRTGRNVGKYYKQTMQEISRTFDNGKVDLGIASKRRLIDAFANSNRWMNERYEIPLPAAPDGDTVSPGPASGSWLDLEAVFSDATLSLIDTLCEAESAAAGRFFSTRSAGFVARNNRSRNHGARRPMAQRFRVRAATSVRTVEGSRTLCRPLGFARRVVIAKSVGIVFE